MTLIPTLRTSYPIYILASSVGISFVSFVDRPGVYTRQQMLQWKQLDAYNYFIRGYVRTVEM